MGDSLFINYYHRFYQHSPVIHIFIPVVIFYASVIPETHGKIVWHVEFFLSILKVVNVFSGVCTGHFVWQCVRICCSMTSISRVWLFVWPLMVWLNILHISYESTIHLPKNIHNYIYSQKCNIIDEDRMQEMQNW